MEFTISDICDISLLFKLQIRKSLVEKRLNMIQGLSEKDKLKKQNTMQVGNTSSQRPILKNNILKERLAYFNKKVNNNDTGRSSIPNTFVSPSEAIKYINPNQVIDDIEKTVENEYMLKSVKNEEITEKIGGLEQIMRDNFCEGFFLASFPTENGKALEGSQEYKSICGHELCSKVPAMEPQILARYPLKDTKSLELNDLAATICFPLGIKICFGLSETELENGEDEIPTTLKNYSSPITNQSGERYHMVTYHFYQKMSNTEFSKLYKEEAVKYYVKKYTVDNADLQLDEEKDKDLIQSITDNLAVIQELKFRDYVYIPYCLCLISKFPYINQLEQCLQSLYTLFSDKSANSNNINKAIEFLIHSLSVPNLGSNIKFYMPNYAFPIQITCPKIDDFEIITNNLTNLLYLFTPKDIETILRLILFEQKILFVGKSLRIISEVTDSLLSLIYPFEWPHTYVPIMSYQMLQYLEAFLPFINGIHESLLPYTKEIFTESEETSPEVYLVYIDTDEVKRKPKSKIDLSQNLIKKKVNVDDKM